MSFEADDDPSSFFRGFLIALVITAVPVTLWLLLMR